MGLVFEIVFPHINNLNSLNCLFLLQVEDYAIERNSDGICGIMGAELYPQPLADNLHHIIYTFSMFVNGVWRKVAQTNKSVHPK